MCREARRDRVRWLNRNDNIAREVCDPGNCKGVLAQSHSLLLSCEGATCAPGRWRGIINGPESEVINDGCTTNIPDSSGVLSNRGAAMLPFMSRSFLRWGRGDGVVLKRKDIFFMRVQLSAIVDTARLGL